MMRIETQLSLEHERPIDFDTYRRAGSPGPEALYEIHHVDVFVWMAKRPPNSIHAIVTDPPYGLKEFSEVEKHKLRRGRGGVWRIPPSFDGCKRNPLPRFTVLGDDDRDALRAFFADFARHAMRILVPGGHVIIASNPLLSHHAFIPLMDSGFEKRGEIIRLVQTLRGGDRPKNAHDEFPHVTVMPRSGWEPWGLFRKPCEGRVQDNLRKWGTGGLRRVSDDEPFLDVIKSSPTRPDEREIAPHPALKPQTFMRQLVRGALPLARGTILDPFMGAGSTIAAAASLGYTAIGLERDPEYFRIAREAIPKLTQFDKASVPKPNGKKRGLGKGGRTHTFGIKNPAEKLKGAAAYALPGVQLRGGRPVLADSPGGKAPNNLSREQS